MPGDPALLSRISISLFQPADQTEVRELILAGLAGHWGTLDPARNPDLNDIARSYAEAVFLVARSDGRVVATGALVPRAEGEAEIVRMSVAAGLRRRGIGRLILTRLIAAARQAGIRRVILETTADWKEVVDFYLQAGFRITHSQDGDVYFTIDI